MKRIENVRQVGKLNAAFWRRNGDSAKGWMKKATESENYVQMADNDEIVAAIGLVNDDGTSYGDGVWLRVERQPDDTAIATVLMHGTGKPLFTMVLRKNPGLAAQAVQA